MLFAGDDGYIIRWPPWVGGLIAVTIVSCTISIIYSALRRSSKWLVVTLAAVITIAFLVTLSPEVWADPGTSHFVGAFALIGCALIFFVAPAVVLARPGQPDMTLARGFRAALVAIVLTTVALTLIYAVSLVILRVTGLWSRLLPN